jgi:transposase
MTAAGATSIYLPLYSLDFSPIENYWSKIKSILRTLAARTCLDLLKALEEVFAKVTQKNLLGCSPHCSPHCCYCAQQDWGTFL